MLKQDSDLILFQFLAKAKISPEEAIQIKHYITSIIKEVVQEAVKSNIPKHNCPIPKNFNSEVIHLVKTIEALGEDNISHGIERIGENHRVVFKVRKVFSNIGKVLSASIVVSIVGGFIAAIVHYLKTGLR